MGDGVMAVLDELSGPEMYRKNSFRLVGLPTTAERKTVRQRQRKIMPLLEREIEIDLGHAIPLSPRDARAAFDRLLNDPTRRIVDELFWMWGVSDLSCGCPEGVHREHDSAVRAHSNALDLELRDAKLGDDELDSLEELWTDAARLWGKTLRKVQVWDHLRHRITVLDERQLDEAAIDALRDQVPTVLVRPMIELAVRSDDDKGWLAARARAWPGVSPHIVEDELERVAEPLYSQVASGTTRANELLREGNPEEAVRLVHEEVLEPLHELTELFPADRNRRTATESDSVAIVVNNAANRVLERDGPSGKNRAGAWFDTAKELATDPQTQSAIEENRSALRELDQLVAAQRYRQHNVQPYSSPIEDFFSVLYGVAAVVGLLVAIYFIFINPQ